jgi:large subunit ribosomal protein L9
VEVILLKDVDNVGLRGEVVNVSRGFMRNYLQPRRLAEAATPGRVAELERREAERARHEARSVEQAREIAETLRKTVLRFEVQAGPRGTLFGSVTPTDVADELWRARRIRVDRRKIQLSGPIKRVGRYEIPIEVFQDVDVEVKTLVVPEGGDLPSDEELAAWEAEERAAAGGDGEAAAPVDEEAPAEAADEGDLPDEVEAGEAAEAAEAADGRPAVEDEERAVVEDEERAVVEDGEPAEHLGRGQTGETP